MEIGNIIYLHIFDLEPILLVTQELKEERFCKIIEVTPVKGGKEGEQYINYKVQSLFTDKIFEVNNYFGPYSGTSIEGIEELLKTHEENFMPERLEDIKYLIDKVKEMIK